HRLGLAVLLAREAWVAVGGGDRRLGEQRAGLRRPHRGGAGPSADGALEFDLLDRIDRRNLGLGVVAARTRGRLGRAPGGALAPRAAGRLDLGLAVGADR